MIQVESGLPITWRCALVLSAVVCAVVTNMVYKANPGGFQHFIPVSIAVIALGLGLGRFIYTIRANDHVHFRLLLFGIPMLSQIVRASSFHSMEIQEERDRSVTLRFLDPSRHPRLTLSGFPTRELAERVGTLFPIDEERQGDAIRSYIEDSVADERWFSLRVALLLVGVVFCVMPGLAWMMGFTLDEMEYPITAGALITLFTACATKRESGIIAVAEDHSHIDRWTRYGWFRILEYRQQLGQLSEHYPLRLRWDHGLWFIPLAVLAQITCVFLVCRHLSQQAEAHALPYHATPEFRDSEAVRKGVERFQQLRKQRDNEK